MEVKFSLMFQWIVWTVQTMIPIIYHGHTVTSLINQSFSQSISRSITVLCSSGLLGWPKRWSSHIPWAHSHLQNLLQVCDRSYQRVCICCVRVSGLISRAHCYGHRLKFFLLSKSFIMILLKEGLYSLRKKATVHQLTTILSTSKNVLFRGG